MSLFHRRGAVAEGRYDSADYLTDIEDVAAYLEVALDEADDDPSVVAQALGRRLRRTAGRLKWANNDRGWAGWLLRDLSPGYSDPVRAGWLSTRGRAGRTARRTAVS